MQLTNSLALLAALLSLTAAAPATTPAEVGTAIDSELNARAAAGTVSVTTFSGDACTGANDQVVVTSGAYRCFPVSNKRSISVSGNCRVTTWSGGDCRGSSFVTPGNGCFSVLYGSVSIQC